MRNTTRKFLPRQSAVDRLDPSQRESLTHLRANRPSSNVRGNDNRERRSQVQTAKLQALPDRDAQRVCEIQPGGEEDAFGARTLCGRSSLVVNVPDRAWRSCAPNKLRNNRHNVFAKPTVVRPYR